MTDKKNKDKQPGFEDRESGLRSLMAEAKADPNGVAIQKATN